MASTNTPSVAWVIGETTGRDGLGGTTTNLPQGPIFHATNTTVPTDEPFGYNVHIDSDGGLYLWDADEWVGPYALAT